MEIQNEINNNIKLEKNNFFNNILGQTINNAFDIGLKAVLPDVIENQVIDIKNALLENGLKSGINIAIESILNFKESATGIFTGNFDNISQMKLAIGEGGIIDTISDLLDKTINVIVEKGHINYSIAKMIKGGKNVILENIETNIKKEMDVQNDMLKKIDENIKKWKLCYEIQDFNGMIEQYNQINLKIDEIIPVENVLNEARKIQNIHNLIKNNGQNFNITELEKELAEKLSI